MNIQSLSAYLRGLVGSKVDEAARRVALKLRDEILKNTAKGKGFKGDPYFQRLHPKTIAVKKKRGTYDTRISKLRDRDRSIEKLDVNSTTRGMSVIDFRTTGKGDLYYAHHTGQRPPKPYQPYYPGSSTAYGKQGKPRSIIPLKESSIPLEIHQFAGKILLNNIQGFPNIVVRGNYSFEQVPF